MVVMVDSITSFSNKPLVAIFYIGLIILVARQHQYCLPGVELDAVLNTTLRLDISYGLNMVPGRACSAIYRYSRNISIEDIY